MSNNNNKKYKKGRTYYGTLTVEIPEVLIPDEDTNFEGMVELAVKYLLSDKTNLNNHIAGNGISVFIDEETNMDPEEDLYTDD